MVDNDIPEGWTAETFEVQAAEQGSRKRRGLTNPPFGMDRRDGWWWITHLPSGCSISNKAGIHRTMKAAAEVCSFIRPLVNDWGSVQPGDDAIGDRLWDAVYEQFPDLETASAGVGLGKPTRMNEYPHA